MDKLSYLSTINVFSILAICSVLKRLNKNVHSPCYLLHINDVNVLLDCCLDTSLFCDFLPNHQLLSKNCSDLPNLCRGNLVDEKVPIVDIDGEKFIQSNLGCSLMSEEELSSVIWDTVDVILVSNTQSLLGLPFICSHTRFRGSVLTSEPVFKFGKILMEELLEALEQLSHPVSDFNDFNTDLSSHSSELTDMLSKWRLIKPAYTREAVGQALDMVKLITYHEPFNLFGLLTVKAVSAGYKIGSCNWTIASPTEKISYISFTSLLYSHVMPFDESAFADSDTLIVGTVNRLAMSSGELEKTVGDFRHIIVQTLARGGHVLVPTDPCGVLFDLVETACHALDNFNGNLLPFLPSDNDSSDLSRSSTSSAATSTNKEAASDNSRQQPIILEGGSSLAGRVARSPLLAVSSQIDVALAYANAYGEWLAPEKEAFLYKADPAFPFQSLLASGKLLAMKNLYDNNSSDQSTASVGWSSRPSLIFTSHPSLRLGPVVHLLRALAYGNLRLGLGRNSLSLANPPAHHSVVLIDSGDYVEQSSSHYNHLDRAKAMLRRLLLPFTLTNSNSRGDLKENGGNEEDERIQIVLSPAGIPCVELSPLVTVFWLPMEPRVGPQDATPLILRCGLPKYCLVVPNEVDIEKLTSILPNSLQLTRIEVGQQHNILSANNNSPYRPINVSQHLIGQLKPFQTADLSVKQASPAPTSTSSKSRRDSDASSTSSRPPSATSNTSSRKHVFVSSACSSSSNDSSGDQPPTAKIAKQSSSDTAILARPSTTAALVNGKLGFRDGSFTFSTSLAKSCTSSDNDPPSSALPSDHSVKPATNYAPVLLSCTSTQIDPSILVKALTDKGLHGAFVANPNAARKFIQSRSLTNASSGLFILFPDPQQAAIRLDRKQSHIYASDDSTRRLIREALLDCLPQTKVECCLADSSG